MRAKKRTAVAPANVKQAWSDFFDANRIDDLDAYIADGWMTAEMIGKKLGVTQNVASCQLYNEVQGGKFETKDLRVMLRNRRQPIKMYRPIL